MRVATGAAAGQHPADGWPAIAGAIRCRACEPAGMRGRRVQRQRNDERRGQRTVAIATRARFALRGDGNARAIAGCASERPLAIHHGVGWQAPAGRLSGSRISANWETYQQFAEIVERVIVMQRIYAFDRDRARRAVPEAQ
ncbi:hypothetical protein DFQ30_008469 [Apophysomyces sp. BC1015]|nr:hypothetical protein DFQ30_008469 [Apophysomyces sp. BC1015]